jgi:hypothetical protein
VTRWQRSPGVVWRRSDTKIALLCPGSDALHLLTGTSAVVWQLLDEPIDEQDLVSALAAGFDADPDDVASTLAPFLQALAEIGAAHRR